MDNIQNLLQISAKLYQFLGGIPQSEERQPFIDEINRLLDDRDKIINILRQENFIFDSNVKSHQMLYELDKGINKRLQLVMNEIKKEMKDIQNIKKNENQYRNPYAHLQVMDGRYYDKKK